MKAKAEIVRFLKESLREAFQHDGPALVEALVHPQERSIPPRITLEAATGFGIYVLKAVINGRGDELIDLAKINLFR